MTKQSEALRLADVLIGSPQFSGTPIWQAADMLRRQHEAIKKLREALNDTAQNLVWMQWGDCRKFQTKGPMITVHEAVAIAEQALKDTEEFV